MSNAAAKQIASHLSKAVELKGRASLIVSGGSSPLAIFEALSNLEMDWSNIMISLVDDRLVLEIKSVETISRAHAKQLLTYLRLLKQPVGLLLNFSEATMKDGIRRLVNDYKPG